MIGTGTICPRCQGPKPKGSVGKGIALSRRGKAAICSDCGTEEAMVDFLKEKVPAYAKNHEIRLCRLLTEKEDL